MTRVRRAAAPAPAVEVAREALGGASGAWIVGGAVRDALARARGRRPRPRRRRRSRRRGAGDRAAPPAGPRSSSRPSSAPGGRSPRDRSWHVDVSRPARRVDRGRPRRCATSPSTRSRSPLADRRAEPIDPTGGLADLERGVLRAVSERSFADDPLRILRAARLGAELGLELDPRPCALARGVGRARRRARRRAPARRAAAAGLRARTRCAGSSCSTSSARPPACCPSSRRCAASARTPTTTSTSTATRSRCCANLLEVEARPRPLRRRQPPTASRELLAEPLADELTRGDALRFGALLHDVGKPGDPRGARGRLRLLHRPRPRRAPRSSARPARG